MTGLRKRGCCVDSVEQVATEGTREVTPPVAAQAAEHVAEASTEATQAAEQTGQDGWKVIAEELRGLRKDITKLLEKPARETEHVAENAVPEVEVEQPKPPERKVRRGSRKVTRRG